MNKNLSLKHPIKILKIEAGNLKASLSEHKRLRDKVENEIIGTGSIRTMMLESIDKNKTATEVRLMEVNRSLRILKGLKRRKKF